MDFTEIKATAGIFLQNSCSEQYRVGRPERRVNVIGNRACGGFPALNYLNLGTHTSDFGESAAVPGQFG